MSRWIAGYYPYYFNSVTQEYEQPELALEFLKMNTELNPFLQSAGETGEKTIDHLADFLKRIESSKSTVIILADEVNSLVSPLAYRDIDSNPLKIDKMPVLRMLRDFVQNPRYQLVAALCNNNPQLSLYDLTSTLQATEVKLDYFDDQEVFELLKYYQSLGQIANSVFDLRYARKIRFVSGGCGSKLLSSAHYEAVYQN